MNINRAAYIAAITAMLNTVTDEQLNLLWCMAVKLILEQEEPKQ